MLSDSEGAASSSKHMYVEPGTEDRKQSGIPLARKSELLYCFIFPVIARPTSLELFSEAGTILTLLTR